MITESSFNLSKGERTRQQLLDAAYSLFLDQGFAATSMRQIAEQSGLALSGIYNHFPSKEAIFIEVLLQRHPFHTVFPLLLSAPGETAEEFIRNAAHLMINELGHRPDFVKLLFTELVEFEGRDLPAMFSTFYPMVLPVVEKFQQNRKELRDIPPIVLFRAFLGLFFSYYMTEMLFANIPVEIFGADHLDHFVDIFLHGVIASKDNK
jgi:AcrR family transcriptional regulator